MTGYNDGNRIFYAGRCLQLEPTFWLYLFALPRLQLIGRKQPFLRKRFFAVLPTQSVGRAFLIGETVEYVVADSH